MVVAERHFQRSVDRFGPGVREEYPVEPERRQPGDLGGALGQR